MDAGHDVLANVWPILLSDMGHGVPACGKCGLLPVACLNVLSSVEEDVLEIDEVIDGRVSAGDAFRGEELCILLFTFFVFGMSRLFVNKEARLCLFLNDGLFSTRVQFLDIFLSEF